MSRTDDSGPGGGLGRSRSLHRWGAIVPAVLMASVVLAGCDGPGSDASPGSARQASIDADSSRPILDRATPSPEQTPDTAPAGELRVALERLVAGESSPEVEATTWFSSETAGALRSVRVDSAGHATVDFNDLRPLIPNASSSAGSRALLRELDATVFGVDGIRSVEYRMEGSCDLFWEWLQYECRTVTNADAGARGP